MTMLCEERLEPSIMFNSLALPPQNSSCEKTIFVAYNSISKELGDNPEDILFTAFDSTGKLSLTFDENDVEDLKSQNILSIQIAAETGLIHILDSYGRIYIVNHEIKAKNMKLGLIFTLDLGLTSFPKSFYVPSNLQGKVQLPMLTSVLTPSGHKLGANVEEFRLKQNLKPKGFLLNVASKEVQLWNLNDQQDRQRRKCKLESSLSFDKDTEILDCAFNDKQNLLVLLYAESFNVSTI